jgi:hypothetical protein
MPIFPQNKQFRQKDIDEFLRDCDFDKLCKTLIAVCKPRHSKSFDVNDIYDIMPKVFGTEKWLSSHVHAADIIECLFEIGCITKNESNCEFFMVVED